MRESSGGFVGVQALGLAVAGRAQVSMNLLDTTQTALHEVVECVTEEARRRGVEVLRGELVGLMPASVAVGAAAKPLVLPNLDPSRILELRLLN